MGGFDFFILSDSTDPAQWIAEEVAWQRLSEAPPPGTRIFYRHRHKNTGRKSGNIQAFCENWGSLYDYMVVLDADSLMQGETLIRLVGLMDANPRAALIQVPAQLVGRVSPVRAHPSNSPPVSAMARSRPRGWPGCKVPTAITGVTMRSFASALSWRMGAFRNCRGVRRSAVRS